MRKIEDLKKELKDLERRLMYLRTSKNGMSGLSDTVEKMKELLKREGYTNSQIAGYIEDLEQVLLDLKGAKKTIPVLSDAVESVKDLFQREGYTNPELASYLEGRIFTLREVIAHYDELAEEQERDATLAREEHSIQVRDNLIATAKSIYETRINTYMEQDFWGRAQSLFKGKKPKKLSESDILATYGEEAKGRLIGESIDGIQEQKEALLAYLKEYVLETPLTSFTLEDIEDYMIEIIVSFYDNQIEEVEEDYDNSLNEGYRLLLTNREGNGTTGTPNGNVNK